MPEEHLKPECIAKVVEPDLRKKRSLINCVCCEILDYTHAEYKILKDWKKLVFFTLYKGKEKPVGPSCHTCLNKVVSVMFQGQESVRLRITSKDGSQDVLVHNPDKK